MGDHQIVIVEILDALNPHNLEGDGPGHAITHIYMGMVNALMGLLISVLMMSATAGAAEGCKTPKGQRCLCAASSPKKCAHTAKALCLSGKAVETPMDERERLIDLKGARVGFHMLNLLLMAVASLWLYGMSPLVMANGILAAMVVAETLRAASVVVGYRRGA